MKIIYIDSCILNHSSINDILSEYEVTCYSHISLFLDALPTFLVREKMLIIVDCSIEFDMKMIKLKKLNYLRSVSNGFVQLILFSDFSKVRVGFIEMLLSPNYSLDKSLSIEKLKNVIRKISNLDQKSSNDVLANHQNEQKKLTQSEFNYIFYLLHGMSTIEISHELKIGIKATYILRRNIKAKYKLKSLTKLFSSLVYE